MRSSICKLWPYKTSKLPWESWRELACDIWWRDLQWPQVSYAQTVHTKVASRLPHHLRLLFLYIVLIMNQHFSVNSYLYFLSNGLATFCWSPSPRRCHLHGIKVFSFSFTVVFLTPSTLYDFLALVWGTSKMCEYVPIPSHFPIPK